MKDIIFKSHTKNNNNNNIGDICQCQVWTSEPSAIALDGWDWKLNFQLLISTIELKKVKIKY